MSIATEINRLQVAKQDIKQAIINKGVAVSDVETIDTYASKIDQIQGGGGDNTVLNKLIDGSIEEITIPDGITTICPYGLAMRVSLTSVTIPTSVTSIGEAAMMACPSITTVNYNGTIAQWRAIEKGDYYLADAATDVIHCTDGDVSIYE